MTLTRALMVAHVLIKDPTSINVCVRTAFVERTAKVRVFFCLLVGLFGCWLQDAVFNFIKTQQKNSICKLRETLPSVTVW